jgi:hypothetical protein
MKRIFCTLLVALISFFGYAQDAAVTTTSIHLRESTSQNSESVAIIPQGATIYTGNCQSGWCEVSYNGLTGYVNAHYLKYNSPIAKEVHVVASPTSPVHYYTNVNGNTIQAPTKYDKQPEGATAQCADGTYSFSQHRKGTCSHHGGVARWL